MRALTGAIFGVVLAVALTPVAAVSGPLEEGRGAFERGDYAAALRLLRPLAERGQAYAQDRLGAMYRDGHGVATSSTNAGALVASASTPSPTNRFARVPSRRICRQSLAPSVSPPRGLLRTGKRRSSLRTIP